MRAQYYRAADVLVHRVFRSENPRDVAYLLISYVYTYLHILLRVTSPMQFLSDLYDTPPLGLRAEPRYLLSRETKSRYLVGTR